MASVLEITLVSVPMVTMETRVNSTTALVSYSVLMEVSVQITVLVLLPIPVLVMLATMALTVHFPFALELARICLVFVTT